MTEEKNPKTDNLKNGAIVVAVGAAMWLGVAGNNAQVSNDTNVAAQAANVANLPAVIARMDGLEARLDKAVERSDEDLRREIESINSQINRRETEMFDYIKTLFTEEKRFDDVIFSLVSRLEQEVFDQVPTP